MKIKIKKSIIIFICLALAIAILWLCYGYYKLQSIYLPANIEYKSNSCLSPEVQQIISKERQIYLTHPIDGRIDEINDIFSNAEYDYDVDLSLATMIRNNGNMREYQSSGIMSEYITTEELENELSIIENFYKYTYAGIVFYSMEEPMHQATEEIRIELSYNGDEISALEYQHLLQTKILPILEDNHARIGGISYLDVYSPVNQLMASDASFLFGSRDFHTTINGKKLYFSPERNPNLKIKLISQANGAIEYRLALYNITNDSYQNHLVSVVMVDESGEFIKIPFSFSELDSYIPINPLSEYNVPTPASNTYFIYETTEYTYMKNSSLSEESDMKKMIADAGGINRDLPLIIDLRGNSGGNSGYINQWLLSFYKVPQIQSVFYQVPVSMYQVNSMIYDAALGKRIFSKFEPYVELRNNPKYDMHLENDTPIFVLMDNDVYSSGEWWISYLRRIDNIVFIGENTGGMQIGGNNVFINLPYSNIRLSTSTSISFDNDFISYETTGIEPDVYCDSENALYLVLDLISK